MKNTKIPWCTGQYTTDFAKTKARELRSAGYKVSFGSYVKENDKTYCRIYVEQDLNYYILSSLESIETRIKIGGMTVEKSILLEKEKIQYACKKFATPVRVELIDGIIVAIVNNDYELYV